MVGKTCSKHNLEIGETNKKDKIHGNPISIQPRLGANVIHILAIALIKSVCFRISELHFQDFYSSWKTKSFEF